MKKLVALALGLALAVTGTTAAMANVFSGTPTVYIGYGAGGGTDTAVRPVVAEMANSNAQEYRAVGVTSINGPQIDLSTEPRWSRIQSTFGEDPQLGMDMAAAYVNALQSTYDEEGNDLGWGAESVNAYIKHFPGDGPAEGGRESHNAYGAFNVLPRMRDSIGIVELAITVMDNLHSSGDAVSTGYSIAPDVNPHNRQISRADSHIDIIGRIVGQT